MPASVKNRPIPGRRQIASFRSPESIVADLLTFLIPASSGFTISFGGELPYGEIFTLLLLPAVLVLRRGRAFQKRYRTIYLLMALWFFSQVLTDFYVNASPLDRAKGMARVVYFAIDLIVISALVGDNLRRVKLFALGIATMDALGFVRSSGVSMPVQWKMVLFPAAGIVLFLASSRYYVRKNHAPLWISIFLLAALSVYYGSRSATLFALAAAAPMVTHYISKHGLQDRNRRDQVLKFVALASLALVAAWIAHRAIKWGVHAGIYTEVEDSKFSQQSQGKYGAIVGGRPEWPVAIQAIIDSPILGHGSYATDPKYIALLQDYQYKWGYSDTDVAAELEHPGIPTHSHLTGAWVEGGVLASFIWFYVLWLCARCIFRLTEIFHPLAPLYVFLFIEMFWDILFSPFGEARRLFDAFYIVLMLGLSASKAHDARRRTLYKGIQPVYRRQVVRLTSPYRGGAAHTPRLP